MLMDKEPDMTNLHFIDEYPEIAERLRLQRLARPAVKRGVDFAYITSLPHLEGNPFIKPPEPPDSAA